MNNELNARQQTEAQLIGRAQQDAAFRQELVRDPKGVFVRELGVTMPDNIQVEVLEETPTQVYLVLPQAMAQAGSELSDAQLEGVAGGWTEYTGCGSCVAEHYC